MQMTSVDEDYALPTKDLDALLPRTAAMAMEARLDVDKVWTRYYESELPLHVLVGLIFRVEVSEKAFVAQCALFQETFGRASLRDQVLALEPEEWRSIQVAVVTCHTYHLYQTPGHTPRRKYNHFLELCAWLLRSAP